MANDAENGSSRITENRSSSDGFLNPKFRNELCRKKEINY